MKGLAPDIRIEGIRFAYPELTLNFDVTLRAGVLTAIMGPSGSGKSTLLDLIAGFKHPAAGRILIGGEDVTGLPPDKRPLSMIFQENNLFAHLNVANNVGLGRSPSLRLSADDRTAAEEALARTGLAGKGKRLPKELSGGERQRVAIARVLVRDRPVLLMDEPFASLGPALRAEMLDIVAELQAEKALTVALVTHHPDDAKRIARDIVFIDGGRVAATGSTADFLSEGAPEAFKRYIGATHTVIDSSRSARKPT